MFKLLSLKAHNTQELANIFRSDPQEKKKEVIETGTVLHRSVPLRVLISQTAFLFWGTFATLLIQLCNTAACTCNVIACYVLRVRRDSEGTHTPPQ